MTAPTTRGGSCFASNTRPAFVAAGHVDMTFQLFFSLNVFFNLLPPRGCSAGRVAHGRIRFASRFEIPSRDARAVLAPKPSPLHLGSLLGRVGSHSFPISPT